MTLRVAAFLPDRTRDLVDVLQPSFFLCQDRCRLLNSALNQLYHPAGFLINELNISLICLYSTFEKNPCFKLIKNYS